MLNTIVLVGRVMRPPEGWRTPAGDRACSFAVELSSTADGSGRAEAVPVVWVGPSTAAEPEVRMGDLVAVRGRLSIRAFRGSDGQRRERFEIVGDAVAALASGPPWTK